MALWTGEEAAKATGGTLRGPAWQAEGVSIDTRTIAPGDLFVALTDQRDGHAFVAQALQKGAAAALVSRVPDGLPADAPLLVVGDTLEGLRALGAAGRARTRARVIGVTGSVGKTSTKEMLRAVLLHQGATHAAEASYNNHWGVPLTLARMPRETEYAVIEIGMNHPGEIAPLAKLARPHVALITTVAPAHLEAFGALEGIAREKAAIFEGLEKGGTAIFRDDIEVSGILRDAAKAAGAKAVTFGTSGDFRLTEARLAADATVAEAEGPAGPLLFKLRTPGRHFALNALGALAVARAVKADLALAALDIAAWSPVAGRGTRETLVMDMVDDHLRFDLIDDAFNANPASLEAALDVLAAAEPEDGVGRVAAGRRIAILGDMLELGPGARELHAVVASYPAMKAVDLCYCVGTEMAALHEALPEDKRGGWYPAAEDLAHRVHGMIDAGDVVLVKGSKGSHVSRVVDAIRKLGHPLSADAQGTI